MSTHVLSICWGMDLPPTQKLVLISLADQANDHGDCWPRISSMVQRTGLSERSIQYAVRILEERGILKIKLRAGHSSYYTIRVSGAAIAPPAKRGATRAPRGATLAPRGATRAPPGVQQVHLEPSVEPTRTSTEPFSDKPETQRQKAIRESKELLTNLTKRRKAD